jgi:hypothetical protein
MAACGIEPAVHTEEQTRHDHPLAADHSESRITESQGKRNLHAPVRSLV